MRTKTPDDVERQMKLWRLGLACFPQSYIEFNKKLAEESLDQVKATHEVHRVWMENAGWGDGMMELNAIVEKRHSNVLHKIHWHDGNQGWMVRHACGGSVIFRFDE